MGYDYKSIKKILKDKSLFEGKKILTLGNLFPFLKEKEKKDLTKEGIYFGKKEDFSKSLFVNKIGASLVHTLDVSDYESAEIIANLNKSVDKLMHEKYDVIVDFGTLEHISNLQAGLQNIFDILKNNGIYYFALPSNNWQNHGFYQFSPTYFSDICNQNNSLKLKEIQLSINNKYYELLKNSNFAYLALINSHHPTGISGIIQKEKSFTIDMDFIQGRYVQDHNNFKKIINDQNKVKNSQLKLIKKFIITKLIFPILKSNYLPFELRYNFGKFLGSLKK